MNEFINIDLDFDISQIISFDVPITVSKEYDNNLENPFSIDVEDNSYSYPDAESRDTDFNKLKELVPNFSFIEI